MSHPITLTTTLPNTLADKRLDQALAQVFPEYSRAQLTEWVKQAFVTLDSKTIAKPNYKVKGGETVHIEALLKPQANWQAQLIELEVVYEDEALLITNKPAGLVTHPGAGNLDGTLANALLNHLSDLGRLPRAGLIHRLDKDTSGLLVVAKTLPAHQALTQAMQAREIHRQYQAIVDGVLIAGATIDQPIGRHPHQRTKISVRPMGGRKAITHYRVLKRYHAHTHLEVNLETGRTHQIRVHLAHIHHPIVGDLAYGQRRVLTKLTPNLQNVLRTFPRQALHAAKLCLKHPITHEEMTWQAPLPADMQQLLTLLEEDLHHGT